jgi:hypothetical protein
MQQSPGQASPHSDWAWPTHSASHPDSQQKGSSAHTHASVAGSAHPGRSLVVQQSPAHCPASPASAAQVSLQTSRQQNGSTLQTASIANGSSQPAVALAAQQSPAHSPQSAAQVKQFSAPGSQRPSPQSGSTSSQASGQPLLSMSMTNASGWPSA